MEIRIGILIVSDRSAKGERLDTCGPALEAAVLEHGWQVAQYQVIPDEYEILCGTLVEWADRGNLDVILTSGGTGFSPRDITPEATLAVIQRAAPGLTEAMRAEGRRSTPHAMLSRAVAGIRKKTLIINLPGNPKGALENFQVVSSALPHAVQLLQNDPSSESGHNLLYQ